MVMDQAIMAAAIRQVVKKRLAPSSRQPPTFSSLTTGSLSNKITFSLTITKLSMRQAVISVPPVLRYLMGMFSGEGA
jgi:hypothetical protein